MSKKRTIPFGYIMKDGDIIVNPAEVETVRQIFNFYLAGESLLNITNTLNTTKIMYGNGSNWNKNMIKRIIENRKYIGDKNYPQIISDDNFIKANAHRIQNSTNKSIPEALSEIRKKSYCKECAGRLSRIGGNTKHEKWTCKNEDCYGFDYNLTDNMIISAILTVINTVIANPELINTNEELVSYSPNGIIRRLENEINQIKDAPQIDYVRAREKIYELAAKKFECCITNEKAKNTKVLLSRITNRVQTDEFEIGLFKSCVNKVWISHFCTIEVEFINGSIIKNITERD